MESTKKDKTLKGNVGLFMQLPGIAVALGVFVLVFILIGGMSDITVSTTQTLVGNTNLNMTNKTKDTIGATFDIAKGMIPLVALAGFAGLAILGFYVIGPMVAGRGRQ
jgi:hypothetical protein